MSPSFQAQGSSKRLDPDGTVSEDEGRGWGEGRLGLCLCEVRLRVGVRGGTARRERPAERGRSGWTGLGSETCIFQAWCPQVFCREGLAQPEEGAGAPPSCWEEFRCRKPFVQEVAVQALKSAAPTRCPFCLVYGKRLPLVLLPEATRRRREAAGGETEQYGHWGTHLPWHRVGGAGVGTKASMQNRVTQVRSGDFGLQGRGLLYFFLHPCFWLVCLSPF